MKILGYRARDRVTGFEGVVTSICFDLYGCVQAILTPGLNKDGDRREGQSWYDTKRLEVTSDTPVMEVPTFTSPPGGYEKPAPTSA